MAKLSGIGIIIHFGTAKVNTIELSNTTSTNG
jgi:hypothetical protein